MIIFLVLQDDDQNIIAALYESNYKRMSYIWRQKYSVNTKAKRP